MSWHIISCLAVGFRSLQDGKSQILVQVVLERLCGTVCADIGIADDELDFLADALHLGLSFYLSLLYEQEVTLNAVLFHDTEVHGSRALNQLHDVRCFGR